MNKYKTIILDVIIVLLILVPTVFLRFYDLGYSDYIGDEQKSFLRLATDQNIFQFFMEQRKGPMQFIVSSIPYAITGDYRNEFAQRSIFSFLSVLSIVVFYFMVKKMTESRTAAFVASCLLSFNGFIVGFGRISQYQNINLLFSFLSIYYIIDLRYQTRHLLKSALLSLIFFIVSFLAHWDAVYIIPVLLVYVVLFLRRPDVDRVTKISIFKNIFIWATILLLPYMLPYVYSQMFNSANQAYFKRRVETGFFDIGYFKFLIDLYNPYITFSLVSVLACLGLLNYKKSWILVIWFVPTFLIFLFFFRKPGTHIYNFVIPAIILAGLGIALIVRFLPKYLKFIPIAALLPVFGFLVFQSYFIFIEHSREYPWEQKRMWDYIEDHGLEYLIPHTFMHDILKDTTPKYTLEQKLPLFGFPHKRYWNEINEFVNQQNAINNESFGYITNEDKSVSEWYMDAKYINEYGFYAVGVKRPTNFIQDYSFPHYGSRKKTVMEFGEPETLVKIYRVEPK